MYAEGYIVFVFSLIRSSVTLQNLQQRVILKFLRQSVLKFLWWGFSLDSIHTWVMGTLEGLLTFCIFWLQGLCPVLKLEVKIWDTLKKC